MPKRRAIKVSDYHLIDIVAGESHGGFITLAAARYVARVCGLRSWQIYQGNTRLEHHDPDGLAAGAAADLTLPAQYRADPPRDGAVRPARATSGAGDDTR